MSGYRAKKAGIALQIQKKLEQRYDEEEGLGTPERVMEWMNAALDGEHPKCSGYSCRRLAFWLRDGVALCKFINKLRVAAGMPAVKYGSSQTALTAFVAMENISKFNTAAHEYGIPEEALFQSVDLYECQKGPFCNVINCLNILGFEANRRGFTPKYEGVEAPQQNDTNHAP